MTALKDGIDHYLRISRVTGTIALVMGCVAVLLIILHTAAYAYLHETVGGLAVFVLIQVCVVIPRIALLEATSAHAGRLAVVLSRISMAVAANEDEAVTNSLADQYTHQCLEVHTRARAKTCIRARQC